MLNQFIALCTVKAQFYKMQFNIIRRFGPWCLKWRRSTKVPKSVFVYLWPMCMYVCMYLMYVFIFIYLLIYV